MFKYLTEIGKTLRVMFRSMAFISATQVLLEALRLFS